MKFEGAARAEKQTRTIFTITPHGAGWAVEHDGEMLHPCSTVEEARAAANRLARACQDQGQLCQVNVSGERGFFQARVRGAPKPGEEAPASLASAPVEVAGGDAAGHDSDAEKTHPPARKADLVSRDRRVALQLRLIS